MLIRVVFVFLFTVIVTPVVAQTQSRESCVTLKPRGAAPHTAEDHVFPLSLRAHIVRMVKEQMNARGEYDYAIDHTFQPRFHEAIARRQSELGEMPTGCLTWSVVRFYDPLDRKPPAELQ